MIIKMTLHMEPVGEPATGTRQFKAWFLEHPGFVVTRCTAAEASHDLYAGIRQYLADGDL